jgi:hypothetical protein
MNLSEIFGFPYIVNIFESACSPDIFSLKSEKNV